MAVETPATIAVIGAGPIGLEAALYARFLGYKVLLFERARVAERLRYESESLLPAPFAMHRSTLGLAALQAQDESHQLPQDDAVPTNSQWLAGYLEPLSRSDLVGDGLQERTEVEAISVLAIDEADDPDVQAEDDGEDVEYEDVASHQFELLARDAEGRRSHVTVDAVIDVTGGGALSPATEDAPEAENAPEDLAVLTAVGVRSPLVNWCVLESAGNEVQSTFDFAAGLEQIRAVFAVIGGRRDLDLYKTIQI